MVMALFYLKLILVEIWLTLATWSKSRINHYHHPLLNGPGMLTEYFWVGSFPLHFCRILDTTTEHFRPYLEGGVVVFLIPSNLYTVVKWGKMAKNDHHLWSKGYGLEYDPIGNQPCVKVQTCIKILTLTYFQWFKAEKK